MGYERVELSINGIRTTRLVLLPLGPSHSDGMFELWSDQAVCKYSGEVRDYDGNRIPMPARTRADSDKIIDFWLRMAEERTGFRWALQLEGGKFVGTCGFNSLGCLSEIAFHLLPEYWGRGLMREACMAAIAWALSDPERRELEAFVEPANVASSGLLERLKFKLDPVRSTPALFRYCMLRDDWTRAE